MSTKEAQSTATHLRELFKRYQVTNLVTDPDKFTRYVQGSIGVVDAKREGYSPDELDRQRDLSVKFRWGHNHNFGTFRMEGQMGDRHIDVMANFVSLFPVRLDDFKDKDVFDIGCWTGGTSLVLASLGAKVTAIEEVRKYVEMARYLVRAFGQNGLVVLPLSVYSCGVLNDKYLYNRFDIVYCPGVIYHLSDPVLALRIMFNSLRPGGIILLESTGLQSDKPLCRFEGNQTHTSGTARDLSRIDWFWFIPSPTALHRMMEEAGFEDTRTAWCDGRLYAYGRKVRQVGICKAGLSVPGIR